MDFTRGIGVTTEDAIEGADLFIINEVRYTEVAVPTMGCTVIEQGILVHSVQSKQPIQFVYSQVPHVHVNMSGATEGRVWGVNSKFFPHSQDSIQCSLTCHRAIEDILYALSKGAVIGPYPSSYISKGARGFQLQLQPNATHIR
jgi:hypothetical protein